MVARDTGPLTPKHPLIHGVARDTCPDDTQIRSQRAALKDTALLPPTTGFLRMQRPWKQQISRQTVSRNRQPRWNRFCRFVMRGARRRGACGRRAGRALGAASGSRLRLRPPGDFGSCSALAAPREAPGAAGSPDSKMIDMRRSPTMLRLPLTHLSSTPCIAHQVCDIRFVDFWMMKARMQSSLAGNLLRLTRPRPSRHLPREVAGARCGSERSRGRRGIFFFPWEGDSQGAHGRPLWIDGEPSSSLFPPGTSRILQAVRVMRRQARAKRWRPQRPGGRPKSGTASRANTSTMRHEDKPRSFELLPGGTDEEMKYMMAK